MDDRLSKALEHANYSQTFLQQKKIIFLRYENALIYATGGGSFKATPELITFIDLLIEQGDGDAVIISESKTPVQITDLKDFKSNLLTTYHEAANTFHADFEKLRKARKVSAAVGI